MQQDLEFASIMVQNLNLIMITSPELAGFRKRLKTLESKVSAQISMTLKQLTLRSGWTNAVHDSLSLVVAQCRGHFLAVSSCTGVRAGVLSAADLVGTLVALRGCQQLTW